jgi:hypothetical protein
MWPARATVGRQPSLDACDILEGFFMLQSRRGFLIGAGSLLTTAFVSDARSFIRRTSQPLLASPPQVSQMMYWYDIPDEGYQLSLGEWTMDAPPPPTWREFFINQGIAHQTEAEIIAICNEHYIGTDDFDKPVNESYWQEYWEFEENPCTKAHRLLSKVVLGPKLGSACGPLLEFHEGDNHPGSNDIWVNAKDKLSLSLLQARLIDLKIPIKISEGI